MTDIILDQYAPGGPFEQISDAAGDGVVYDQYAPGGPMEQLRVLLDSDLVWDQYAAGGVFGQAEVAAETGGGGGDYVATAVTIADGTRLHIGSLTSIENNTFSFAGWLRKSAFGGGSTNPFVSDIDGKGDLYLQVSGDDFDLNSGKFLVCNDANDDFAQVESINPLITSAEWVCLIGNIDTSVPTMKLYLGDTDVSDALFTPGAPFNISSNGLTFDFLSDGYTSFLCDAADWRIMPGISLLTAGDISEATRRLFIGAAGKPVDPATATLALGAPCMLFSGDADTFATNQGTGGSITLTGSLTNATTSPSD